jgi:hypothetical protein
MASRANVLARNCAARSPVWSFGVVFMLSDKSSVVLVETGWKWVHASLQIDWALKYLRVSQRCLVVDASMSKITVLLSCCITAYHHIRWSSVLELLVVPCCRRLGGLPGNCD